MFKTFNLILKIINNNHNSTRIKLINCSTQDSKENPPKTNSPPNNLHNKFPKTIPKLHNSTSISTASIKIIKITPSKNIPNKNSKTIFKSPLKKVNQTPIKSISDNSPIKSIKLMINLTIVVETTIQALKRKLTPRILPKTIIKTISCCKDQILFLIKALKQRKPVTYHLLTVFLHQKCDLQLLNRSISSKKVNYLLTIPHSWVENQQNPHTHYRTETRK